MFFSTALLASLPLAALAAPYKHTSLYARALVTGNGIEARVEITGHLDGRLTEVKVEGIAGLFDVSRRCQLFCACSVGVLTRFWL